MAVDMKPGGRIESGIPRLLFDTKLTVTPAAGQHAVSADGQRFLFRMAVTESTVNPITVVVNWTTALNK